MKILGIIPARFESSRFPGKPLADILGKSMIRRVYEQASQAAALKDVVVATDDERILLHVHAFGGKAILTSSLHQSGTDRCAEVMEKISGYDLAVNVQGDEPFIDPRQINILCSCFADADTTIATLIKKTGPGEDLHNPNSPKVVINSRNEAIYFSRYAIPYQRNTGTAYTDFYKHIGIYAYRKDTLQAITRLPMSPLEKAEALEQLRWIENGYAIRVALTDMETMAVDTPEDLARIIERYKDR
jgi:3-deoxy-manno-octulosonate cytidylyltransferase (CMP-KDO synthetase)